MVQIYIDIFFCFSWSIDNKIVGGRGGSGAQLSGVAASLPFHRILYKMPGILLSFSFVNLYQIVS